MWVFNHCQSKWKNKIENLGKLFGRILVPQPTRSQSKKQKETEIRIDKDGFKVGSRLD